jgi:hypothetical protein
MRTKTFSVMKATTSKAEEENLSFVMSRREDSWAV